MHTLREMPRNWLRQALCTDLFYPPEMLPQEAIYGEQYGAPYVIRFFPIGQFVDNIKSLPVEPGDKKMSALFIYTYVLPCFAIGYLPPLIYRITFKATVLFYYPFAWVAGVTLGSAELLKTRLEGFTKGELEKVRRWISVLILTALVVKLGLLTAWIDVPAALAQFSSHKFVEAVLVPKAWHWWELTLILDAVLTFGLLFYSDSALRRLDGPDAWDNESVLTTISSVSFARAALAVLTMSYFFWLALMAVTSKGLHF